MSAQVGLAVPLCSLVVRGWRSLTGCPLGFWCLPPPYDDGGSATETSEQYAAFVLWKNDYNQAALESWVEQYGLLQANDALLVDASLKSDNLQGIFAEAFQDPFHFGERTKVWKIVEKAIASGWLPWVGVPIGMDADCLCLITEPANEGLLTRLTELCFKNELPFTWIASR